MKLAKRGLILMGHGARNPAWARPFEAMAAQIRAARPELVLALAYLELLPPTLAEAGQQLVDAGCTHVDIVPVFLGASGHVRRDIPPQVQALRELHGDRVTWRLLDAIGEQASVIAAMASAILICTESTA